MKNFIFFTKESWHYLGCKSGSRRWEGRKVFFTGFIPAYRIFRKLQSKPYKVTTKRDMIYPWLWGKKAL